MAMRMASVCKRRLRPTSRTWLLWPSTIGMMPARAGEAAGFGGGDAAAGVQGAHAGGVEVGQELLEGHRDDDGGAAAAGPGQIFGAEGLDELGEGDAVAGRGGQVRIDPAEAVTDGAREVR